MRGAKELGCSTNWSSELPVVRLSPPESAAPTRHRSHGSYRSQPGADQRFLKVRRARPVRCVIAPPTGPLIRVAFSASPFVQRRALGTISGLNVAAWRLRCEHLTASNNKLQRQARGSFVWQRSSNLSRSSAFGGRQCMRPSLSLGVRRRLHAYVSTACATSSTT